MARLKVSQTRAGRLSDEHVGNEVGTGPANKKMSMKLNISIKIILIAIIFLAGIFRFYGIDWDQGYKLHPDERAIILTVDHLSPPQNLSDFLSPTSMWNPHFFAYGSFPFYLLYSAGHLLRKEMNR